MDGIKMGNSLLTLHPYKFLAWLMFAPLLSLFPGLFNLFTCNSGFGKFILLVFLNILLSLDYLLWWLNCCIFAAFVSGSLLMSSGKDEALRLPVRKLT